MNDTKHHGYIDLNDPLNYAPPRVRERARDLRSEVEQRARLSDPSAPLPAADARRRSTDQFDELADAVARALHDSMEPQLVEPPPEFRERPKRTWIGLAVRFGALAAIVAVAAVALMTVLPSSRNQSAALVAGATPTASLKSTATPAPKLSSKLVVHDSSGAAGEALPLAIGVTAPTPGAMITLNGLPVGTRLTAGSQSKSQEWRVPAREIAGVSIIPPSGFAGDMNLSVELSGDDGVVQVSSFVRLSWLREAAPARPQAALASQAAPAPPKQPEVLRKLDPEEVAGFIRRAQELLTSGDLQPARLLLLRAAEARDPRAALMLARTYDPIVLKQFGAMGPKPDLAQARIWYQAAIEWGASDARNPLDALANYER